MIQTSAIAKTHAAATGLPAWLNGVPPLQWKAVPGSLMKDMDYTPQVNAGLAGNAQGAPGAGFNFYGNPISGPFAYGSMMVRGSDSMALIFGGGGAGAWAGIDVRGLPLEADAPHWTTLVPPAPTSIIWGSRYQQVPATGPHARMKDGVTPNSRHPTYLCQFDDASNSMYLVGCPLVWETDSDPLYPDQYQVDHVSLDTMKWSGPGDHPNCPHVREWQSNFITRDPITGLIYFFGTSTLDVFNPATNSWRSPPLVVNAYGLWDRCVGDVDTGRGLLLRIGYWTGGVKNVPLSINLTTGALTAGTLTGPYASAIDIGTLYMAGMCYCPDLACFLFAPDDGFIYTISYVDGTSWAVDRLALTGVGLPAHVSGNAGTPQICSRFRYVPHIRGTSVSGVVYAPVWNQPVQFFRTA
jgi:hypothetical protein